MRILSASITAMLLLATVVVGAACNDQEADAPGDAATVGTPTVRPVATATVAPTAEPATPTAVPTPQPATPAATPAPGAPTPTQTSTAAPTPRPTLEASVSVPTERPAPGSGASEETELEQVTREVLARHHRAVVEHAPEWIIAAHLENEDEMHGCLEQHAKRRIAGKVGDNDRELQDCIFTAVEGAHAHEFFDLPKEERQARLETLIDSICHFEDRSESESCRAKMDGSAAALIEAEDPLELHKIFTEGYLGKDGVGR